MNTAPHTYAQAQTHTHAQAHTHTHTHTQNTKIVYFKAVQYWFVFSLNKIIKVVNLRNVKI